MSKPKYHIDKPILTEPEETGKEVMYRQASENLLFRRALEQIIENEKEIIEDGGIRDLLPPEDRRVTAEIAESALSYTSVYHEEQQHLFSMLKHIDKLCQHAGDEYANQVLADIGAIVKKILDIN